MPGLVPGIQERQASPMEKRFHVYLMTNRRNGTLYCGVTSDLARRAYEHKSGTVDGFTSRYDLKHLVWFEEAGDALAAIQREKTIKAYPRAWKINLIEERNPQWRDLYDDLMK
jgi:putative endonuclease